MTVDTRQLGIQSLSAVKSAAPIQVMVVDDSAVVRGLIVRQLSSDPQICVVCTAPNGEMAIREATRRSIDVVVLDIEMPVMDGLTALPALLAARPGMKVIMVSALTRRNAEISMRCIQLGATDYVPKPEGTITAAEDFKRELLDKVLALGKPRPGSRAGATAAPGQSTASALTPRRSSTRPSVVAIGASTGGPPALLKLFEALRGSIPQPILLTQHMPPSFTTLLAEQLSRVGDRPCREGVDGEPIRPGVCYVAPGGWHMVAEARGTGPVIRLNQDPPENFCRPAVDPMLRSLAQVYGAGVLAIILTGMGSDGAKGCVAVNEKGGRFVVQDEPTSVVWGMPGAAAQTGLAEKILPLTEIGPWARIIAGAAQ